MTTTSGFTVTVDGSPLPDDAQRLLIAAAVDDSLRLPDAFTLRFRDSERLVIAKSGVKIGSAVVISVAVDDRARSGGGPQTLIEGEVTALEAESDPTGTFTVVRGYDPSHRLFRGRQTHSYTQVTASDVVTRVARRAGLAVGTVQATSTVYDHLSQGGVTDWEFLSGLAREIGWEIAVRAGKLDFGPPAESRTAPDASGDGAGQPLVLRLGSTLLRFRSVVTAAQQVPQVQARGWDLDTKTALVGTAPARTTAVELPTAAPASLAETFHAPAHVASDTAYRSQAEVDAGAVAAAARIAGSFAELDAVARGNPALRAGAAVTLAGVGEPFDGKYVLSSSRHRYDPTSGYTTAFAVTGRQERSLLGLTGGGTAGAGSAARGAAGPVVGLVSDAGDPQRRGRVKLTFPWLSEDYVSDWARTVHPGAGQHRGMVVVPEVGDEVLVAFEQGDLRRPYVLGGLHNGVDEVPATPSATPVDLLDSGSGAINRRSWVSRRGHRIDLLDQDGRSEGVAAATADGAVRVLLDGVGTAVTVHSDGTVTVQGGKGVVVDAGTGTLDLRGDRVTVTARSGVTVDGGTGTVALTTAGPLTAKGTTTTVEGSGTTTVKSTGVLTVQGSLVKIN